MIQCRGLLLAALLLPVFPVSAIPLINGDFTAGLSSWADASGTGTVVDGGGFAVLETGAGDDPFSAVLVQGDDGFFTFNSPLTLGADRAFLDFEARFEDLGADGSEAGASLFTDALVVALYDALDSTLDLIPTPIIDRSRDGLGWLSYRLDVSGLAGRDIALSFELADQDDGRNSRVALDNIVFSAAPTAVPLPSTLLLLLFGIAYLYRPARRC